MPLLKKIFDVDETRFHDSYRLPIWLKEIHTVTRLVLDLASAELIGRQKRNGRLRSW